MANILTYDQLTKPQRKEALEKESTNLLNAMVETGQSFVDYVDDDVIQQAASQAERTQTPWFGGEYIADAIGRLTLYRQATRNLKEMQYANGYVMRLSS